MLAVACMLMFKGYNVSCVHHLSLACLICCFMSDDISFKNSDAQPKNSDHLICKHTNWTHSLGYI